MVATTKTQEAAGRDGWSSRSGFILAAIGAAVGLGNLVRFPAEAAANGGGAFVLFYIFCIALIGLPVLLSETLIGRHGQASATRSVERMAAESGASKAWTGLAGLGVLSAFMILAFYCVIGGWVLYYVGIFVGDLFTSGVTGGALAGMSASDIESIFPTLLEQGGMMSILDAVFVAITLYFVARGVSGGIEKASVVLMPAFFLLLIGITVYGAFTGAFTETLAFLFSFDFTRLTGPVMLAAVGQAFFSLSLGVAGMITYGSYVARDVNLAKTSTTIALADTSVALIAGLCIFPIVLAAGLSSEGGMGLMFATLPHSFQSMPAGSVIGLAFFVMVGFAALTSSVSLMEVPTAWAVDRFGFARPIAAGTVAALALILGVASAYSFNALNDFHPLGFIPLFAGENLFTALDSVTAKLFMPIGALLTTIFVGWIAERRMIDAENGLRGGLDRFWFFLVRWLCPAALAAILIVGIFPDILGT
ncbi:sodium-dependent transporter [Altererythrobacter aurantiacus]|uniref:Sodium-dependent transporter n=1 Tax=Parapontixanthobacter aurantiacus TaxID=1463599 RepID=A0A844ZDC0_9SPHN|nr:sodium-dependent transporter [Parapontixanthobacter aurantiacus]MXO85166.1 sodium-dependent transporter [Parapontixanthobacter aurantiacus]